MAHVPFPRQVTCTHQGAVYGASASAGHPKVPTDLQARSALNPKHSTLPGPHLLTVLRVLVLPTK